MKETKKKRFKLEIQFFDPKTKEMTTIDTLKAIPFTEEEWEKEVLPRRLKQADEMAKATKQDYCYVVSYHNDKTVGRKN